MIPHEAYERYRDMEIIDLRIKSKRNNEGKFLRFRGDMNIT